MKKLILSFILLSMGVLGYSQEFNVFLYQKKGDQVFTTEKNGTHNFTMFLKNYNAEQAQKFAELFKGERGVINVDLSKGDNNMFKVSLNTYRYANTPRYYWFLLKRNHVTTIETPQKTYSIDDYFNIHDKIKIKN